MFLKKLMKVKSKNDCSKIELKYNDSMKYLYVYGLDKKNIKERIRDYFSIYDMEFDDENYEFNMIDVDKIIVKFPIFISFYDFHNLCVFINNENSNLCTGYVKDVNDTESYIFMQDSTNNWGDTIIGVTKKNISFTIYLPEAFNKKECTKIIDSNLNYYKWISNLSNKFKKFYISGTKIKRLIESEEGCIASDRITVDGCKVGFMYRNEPYQNGNADSGWYFLAGDEDEDYMNNPNNHSVYQVNTICNYDSDIIPLLKSPPGSAYIRDKEGNFIVYKD